MDSQCHGFIFHPIIYFQLKWGRCLRCGPQMDPVGWGASTLTRGPQYELDEALGTGSKLECSVNCLCPCCISREGGQGRIQCDFPDYLASFLSVCLPSVVSTEAIVLLNTNELGGVPLLPFVLPACLQCRCGESRSKAHCCSEGLQTEGEDPGFPAAPRPCLAQACCAQGGRKWNLLSHHGGLLVIQSWT